MNHTNQLLKNLKKEKVNSLFTDNVWGADLADTQLRGKSNKIICFYYVLLIFLVNMNGLFLWKIKKLLQSAMLFKKF